MKRKILVDIGMTAALPLLMGYGLIGEAAHEWIGMAMRGLRKKRKLFQLFDSNE